MAYRVVTQSRAESDIEDAFLYISRDAPKPAIKWYKQLKAEIETLSEMPSRCGLAPEASKLGLDVCQLLFGKRTGVYRIIFQIDENANAVNVLAVRHGARKPLQLEDIDDK